MQRHTCTQEARWCIAQVMDLHASQTTQTYQTYPLVIKHSYWKWPNQNSDFFPFKMVDLSTMLVITISGKSQSVAPNPAQLFQPSTHSPVPLLPPVPPSAPARPSRLALYPHSWPSSAVVGSAPACSQLQGITDSTMVLARVSGEIPWNLGLKDGSHIGKLPPI